MTKKVRKLKQNMQIHPESKYMIHRLNIACWFFFSFEDFTYSATWCFYSSCSFELFGLFNFLAFWMFKCFFSMGCSGISFSFVSRLLGFLYCKDVAECGSRIYPATWGNQNKKLGMAHTTSLRTTCWKSKCGSKDSFQRENKALRHRPDVDILGDAHKLFRHLWSPPNQHLALLDSCWEVNFHFDWLVPAWLAGSWVLARFHGMLMPKEHRHKELWILLPFESSQVNFNLQAIMIMRQIQMPAQQHLQVASNLFSSSCIQLLLPKSKCPCHPVVNLFHPLLVHLIRFFRSILKQSQVWVKIGPTNWASVMIDTLQCCHGMLDGFPHAKLVWVDSKWKTGQHVPSKPPQMGHWKRRLTRNGAELGPFHQLLMVFLVAGEQIIDQNSTWDVQTQLFNLKSYLWHSLFNSIFWVEKAEAARAETR